jgi:hypothetical protein
MNQLPPMGIGSGSSGLSTALQVFGWISGIGALGCFLLMDGTVAVISAASCSASTVAFFAFAAILEKVTATARRVEWLVHEMARLTRD